MHRLLTFFIGLHWMAQFGLLAIAFAAAPHGQLPLAFGTFETAFAGGSPLVQAGLATLMTLGLGVTAALFLWMLVTVALDRQPFPGDTDDVARLAFAAAIGMFTFVFVTGEPATGWMSAISLQIAALLASYAAVNIERRSAAETAAAEGSQAGVNAMARSAAHNTMLSRISGRTGAEGSL